MIIRARSTLRVLLYSVFIFLISCSETSPESAIKEIEKQGYSFNKRDFIAAINKQNTDIVWLFLKAGMDPKTEFTNFDKVTAEVIIMAANRGNPTLVKMLLDGGADINTTIKRRPLLDTPITTAIKNGHLEVIEILLESGADLSIRNNEKLIIDEAFEFARKFKHLKGHPDEPAIKKMEFLVTRYQ